MKGYFHAGGILADALVPNQTAAGVKMVFGPKVRGFISAHVDLVPMSWSRIRNELPPSEMLKHAKLDSVQYGRKSCASKIS